MCVCVWRSQGIREGGGLEFCFHQRSVPQARRLHVAVVTTRKLCRKIATVSGKLHLQHITTGDDYMVPKPTGNASFVLSSVFSKQTYCNHLHGPGRFIRYMCALHKGLFWSDNYVECEMSPNTGAPYETGEMV